MSKMIRRVSLSRRPGTTDTWKRTTIINLSKVDLEDEILKPDVRQHHPHHQLTRPSWVKVVVVGSKIECIHSLFPSPIISPDGIDCLPDLSYILLTPSGLYSSSSIVRSISLMFRPSPSILFRPGDDPRLFTLPPKSCCLTRLRPHYTVYYL
jgi:hypothetical protein